MNVYINTKYNVDSSKVTISIPGGSGPNRQPTTM